MTSRESEPSTRGPLVGVTTASRLPDAIPAKGDDWAQNLARLMAWPLLAMGFGAVLAGLGTGIAAGVNFGDAFSPSAELADLGRAGRERNRDRRHGIPRITSTAAPGPPGVCRAGRSPMASTPET